MRVLEAADKNFPAGLKKITPKVKKLYSKGNFTKNLFIKSLTVVGARKMTQYGQRVIDNLLPPLVDSGITIISGFMYGVDQAAHKKALELGGKTIAVLGWGIDWSVGASDIKLYREIEEKGLILSEFENDLKPQLWMFPRRNRIMAGLSRAVLVIEAAQNSGSLITAGFALKFRKKLLAVPGPVTSAVSQGTNGLIKSGKAVMITSASDILNVMNWHESVKKKKSQPVNDSKDIIIKLLADQSLTVDEIALSVGQPVDKVSVKLSLLQLKGWVEEKEGKYYSKMDLT
ncbi:DNA protecting protein DprA [Candidatus Gottesmanbacteria bacterium RIFCSPHIGHO2_02_FULL_40_24]|uniref:DNA protecting protein DprA n=1 Tax=Candidatus Gottesmanbacteria bacterium RIFCSPHIGHO2_01_FULL_40_15 TaxID=1798376 RepID=A0A1F5Z417_9BACT|nr:MAG: DNA protecting protein DprA [Candidatus Gottesmanbacteria bacterium RIFCSPHIGHO2_01_FULL_40_15]OGG18568.1 MAG: DNA protecting protein DprA [Candidatus Gottesmanbacteria bacterium RIFCSPHIGHO2_02_FULL_40_24]OGG22407.1 MAG: DNA protecting protein DprA [Candidatus Gottesmanbacteria bacterium RIFCSPLOWO2_01_FULL_40_10]OGG25938.1 MAG: DNA protecting protein DprA [Candidatus Gottesmanbacteria bacterium RIFCSPHIGHO2_12_FULL_40_13]OGG32092.1 MAG: DNA protecting protein DprA [Candidatus Gottesma